MDSLFRRRIEFHPARNPASSFKVSGRGDFYLETLNPDLGPHRPAPNPGSSVAPAAVAAEGKRSDVVGIHGLDQELSFQITVRRIGAGLANLGNTCFLNSVLQCLTYTEPFAAYLQSGKHKSTCHTSGFCALCALQNHVRAALQSSGKILSPLNLVKNLRCISRNFRNSRQEDAHEYMVNLLESMHKCCLPSGISSESPGAYEKSLVHKIFGGRLRSQVKCMQCSYSSNKFDPFLDLSLEISKADSLHKALAHFTAVEYLDDGAKQYQCSRCKEKVRAQKHLTICNAPNVLSVHLKRFGSNSPGQKIDKMVNFGPTLDLKTFTSNPQEDMKYTLYGVLVHAGWSTHSGHYYCFVRTSSGIWHSLDDNQVSQVSEKKVLAQKAYMLFYTRNRSSSTKCPANVACKENSSSNISGHRMVPSSASVLCEAFLNKNSRVIQEERSSVSAAEFSSNGSASASKSSLKISREVCTTFPKTNGYVAGTQASQQPNACPEPPGKQVDKDITVSGPTVVNIVTSVASHQGSSSKTDVKICAPDVILCVPATSPPINSMAYIENSSKGHRAENELNEDFNSMNNIQQSDMQHKQGRENLLQFDGAAKTIGLEVSIVEEAHKVAEKDPPTSKCRGMHIKTKSSRKLVPGMAVYFGCKHLYRTSLHALKCKKHKIGKKKRRLRGKEPMSVKTKDAVQVGGELVSEAPVVVGQDRCRSSKKRSRSNGKDRNDEHATHLCGSMNTGVIETEVSSKYCIADSSSKQLERSASPEVTCRGARESSINVGARDLCSFVNMLTRGLAEPMVAKWEDADLPSFQTTNIVQDASNGIIGHVLNEWDEEYDRGRRKKVKKAKHGFGGPNPFQEIADLNSWQKNMKTKLWTAGQASSGTKPFSI